MTEYRAKRVPLIYFKSARGTPVDLIWDGIPIKIVSRSGNLTSGLGSQERSLTGAMKARNAERGLLVAPTDRVDIPKRGVGLVPWSFWS